MTTWIITDTHLGHDKMVEYCGRPQNHTDLIFAGLLNLKNGDTLIHLGDICIGKDEEYHRLLNVFIPKEVTRILVKGNHDKRSDNWYLTHGWDFVCEQFSKHYFGQYITFSHIPIPNPQNLNIHGHFHNNLHRLLEGRFVVAGEKERNEEVISTYNPKLHKLLCLEDENYQPISLEKLINKK